MYEGFRNLDTEWASYDGITHMCIWDEAPMALRYALEIMVRTLKDIMSNDSLFGSKIFVLGGDFGQLLPILPRSIRSEVINLSIQSSILWNVFTIFFQNLF